MHRSAASFSAWAALAFESSKKLIGLELEIAGSELANPEAAKVFSRGHGKPVKFQNLPCPSFGWFWEESSTENVSWFNDAGFMVISPNFAGDFSEISSPYPRKWLREEGWHKRALRFRVPKGWIEIVIGAGKH